MAVAAEAQQTDLSVLSPGARFHDVYEIVRCIKAGGMGAVYEVLQTNTKRRRALKVMLPSIVLDLEMRDRFKLEATVAANIDSEHIVETLDAGVDTETGMPFIVMELLKGQELSALIREVGPLPPADAVMMLQQVAMALDKTHAQGIIHRDLKPENIFVTKRDDGSPRLKVLDFGVAKIVADNTAVVDATRSVGSPLYMAPEQIKGDQRLTPKADLYALAHIAFAMLVGIPYWVTERRATDGLYGFLLRVAEGTTIPAAERARERGTEMPNTFSAWFAKATALAPQDRYESATATVAALADALGVSSVLTEGSTSQRFTSRPNTQRVTPGAHATPILQAVPLSTPTPAKSKRPWVALAIVGVAVGIGGAIALRSAADPAGNQTTGNQIRVNNVSAELGASLPSAKPASEPSGEIDEAPPSVTPAPEPRASVAAEPSSKTSKPLDVPSVIPASSTTITKAQSASATSAAPSKPTTNTPTKSPGKPNPLDEY